MLSYTAKYIFCFTVLMTYLQLTHREKMNRMNIRRKIPFSSTSFLMLILIGRLFFNCSSSYDFDVIIKNALVIDGTGAAGYTADIAVKDGIIREIGMLPNEIAGMVIDANGRVVTPGFIDMMGGSSVPLLSDPVTAESKLRQGITTMLVGEGTTVAPRSEASTNSEYRSVDETWSTYSEYFPLLEKKGIALNVLHTVGSSQVRRIVVGEKDRAPTPGELEKMKELVSEAIHDGAVGLSTALIYPPGAFASTEEITELARTAAEHGGIYLSHIRNESGSLLEAVDEVIRISSVAGLPSHIFHLKAAGQDNWPLMEQALQKISDARRDGLDITADIYPYIRSRLGLSAFIHPNRFAHGEDALFGQLNEPNFRQELRREIETIADWENFYRQTGSNWYKVLITGVNDEQFESLVGLSIEEAAAKKGVNVWDMFFDLVIAGTSVAPVSMNEEQKHLALRADFICFDNDASPINPESTASAHPRAFGAFPRILAHYVREKQIISLKEAVRKMTSLPAEILKLADRGQINPGYAADIVIFDPETIQDRATFTDPLRYAEGIDYMLVNGKFVIENGHMTGARPGIVIRHEQ